MQAANFEVEATGTHDSHFQLAKHGFTGSGHGKFSGICCTFCVYVPFDLSRMKILHKVVSSSFPRQWIALSSNILSIFTKKIRSTAMKSYRDFTVAGGT